jgi:hypothetical protein
MIGKFHSTQAVKHLFCVERDKYTYTEFTYWDLREYPCIRRCCFLPEGGSRLSVFIHQNRAQFIGCHKMLSFSMGLILCYREIKQPSFTAQREKS